MILEGGGLRGIFTAGVLDWFLEQERYFPKIYAVSAGACHAASYISRQHQRAFRVGTEFLRDKRYCSLHSLLTTGDLFGVEMCYKTIPDELMPYDYQAALDYPGTLYPVVTDCTTGQPAYPVAREMHGDIQWVRASASLPLVSRDVMIDGVPYLDGGLTDPIPLQKALDDGCKKPVVVLTRCAGYRKQPDSLLPLLRMRYRRYPQLVEAMERRHLRYNETMERIEREEQAGRCFVIRPQTPPNVGRVEKDKEKMTALYQAGYELAKACEPALQAFLRGE